MPSQPDDKGEDQIFRTSFVFGFCENLAIGLHDYYVDPLFHFLNMCN